MINRISAERNDLFEPNIYISIMFDIIGNVIPDKLISAINETFSLFETTMSQIILLPDGEACYQKILASGCQAKITQMDWLSLIHENEKRPFSIQAGELCVYL